MVDTLAQSYQLSNIIFLKPKLFDINTVGPLLSGHPRDTEIIWDFKKWLLNGGWPLKRWPLNRGSAVCSNINTELGLPVIHE